MDNTAHIGLLFDIDMYMTYNETCCYIQTRSTFIVKHLDCYTLYCVDPQSNTNLRYTINRSALAYRFCTSSYE